MAEETKQDPPFAVRMLTGIAHAHGNLNTGTTYNADQVGEEIRRSMQRENDLAEPRKGKVNINVRAAGEDLLRAMVAAGRAEEVAVEGGAGGGTKSDGPPENKGTGPAEKKGGK